MKKALSLLLASVMLMPCLSACSDKIDKLPNVVIIDVKDFGKIKVELDPNVAPITVKNFKKLVSEKFYDGLTFHRIIEGFMIQGGCPNGNGTGGYIDANGKKVTIKGEFSENGVSNTLRHTRGVISMARSSHPDSASSQFFICHEDAPHLNGKYASFGKVIEGMDVVDAIAVVDTNSNDKPIEAVVINSITFAE
ncbi:MAG: peptidylprolyl isomerase [Ruminococcaceae bacterium]|nr:peptidylprolyl isomerase [Oscillospiraceae bacterium]